MSNLEKRYKPNRNLAIYIATLLLSGIFLFVGNRIAVGEKQIFGGAKDVQIIRAKVIQIIDVKKNADVLPGMEEEQNTNTVTTYTFTARALSGAQKRKTITATQDIASLYGQKSYPVRPGDTVLIDAVRQEGFDGEPATMQYIMMEHSRTAPLLALAALFALAVLCFARKKGFDTLLSLGITILAIFIVLLPAVLTGRNIYGWTMLVCTFVILTNLLLVQGVNAKSLTAAVSCLGGLLFPSLLAMVMRTPMRLTGLMDEDAVMLTYLDPPINVQATIACMFLIGCVGALMDISMTIVSALHEIREKEPNISGMELMRSGNSIGKDLIGTMANTLVLAFIGGSMSEILLLVNYSSGLMQVLNKEMVAVEILQSLVSCFSVVLTIPLTSFLCSALYRGKGGGKVRVEY